MVLNEMYVQVIKERLKARDEADKTTPDTKSSEDDNIYTSNRKRRLAFVDMLLSERSLSETDIQEEVDTFMFEVSAYCISVSTVSLPFCLGWTRFFLLHS